MEKQNASPEDLESAFVTCLKAVDDLMEARKILEADLRAGFLDVARARYAMGQMRVSSLQYDTNRMETTTFVVTSSGERGGDSSASCPEWSLLRKTADKAPAQQPAQMEDVATSVPEGGLRRRVPRSGSTGGAAVIPAVMEESRARPSEGDSAPGEAAIRKQCDSDRSSPLRWFGGLVSPHLHHAQSHFVTALEHVMDVARAQSRMQAAQARFDRLRGITPSDADRGERGDGDSDEECITEERGL